MESDKSQLFIRKQDHHHFRFMMKNARIGKIKSVHLTNPYIPTYTACGETLQTEIIHFVEPERLDAINFCSVEYIEQIYSGRCN